jgi:hypothetical protein
MQNPPVAPFDPATIDPPTDSVCGAEVDCGGGTGRAWSGAGAGAVSAVVTSNHVAKNMGLLLE